LFQHPWKQPAGRDTVFRITLNQRLRHLRFDPSVLVISAPPMNASIRRAVCIVVAACALADDAWIPSNTSRIIAAENSHLRHDFRNPARLGRHRRRRCCCPVDECSATAIIPSLDANNGTNPRVLPLTICIQKSSAKTESKLAFDVCIQNTSDTTVCIDEDLACFFFWKIEDANRTVVKAADVPEKEQPPLPKLRTLRPQEVFLKTVELDGFGARELTWARGYFQSPMGSAAHFTQGSIRKTRYSSPDRSTRLRVILRYDSTDPDMLDAFSILYGSRPETLHVKTGISESNPIQVAE
jgi:hypothetical protein